jgi:hypothetical protein
MSFSALLSRSPRRPKVELEFFIKYFNHRLKSALAFLHNFDNELLWVNKSNATSTGEVWTLRFVQNELGQALRLVPPPTPHPHPPTPFPGSGAQVRQSRCGDQTLE